MGTQRRPSSESTLNVIEGWPEPRWLTHPQLFIGFVRGPNHLSPLIDPTIFPPSGNWELEINLSANRNDRRYVLAIALRTWPRPNLFFASQTKMKQQPASPVVGLPQAIRCHHALSRSIFTTRCSWPACLPNAHHPRCRLSHTRGFFAGNLDMLSSSRFWLGRCAPSRSMSASYPGVSRASS